MQRFAEKHVVHQVAEAVAAGRLPPKTEVRTSRTYSKKGMRYFIYELTDHYGWENEEFIGQGASAAVKWVYELTGIAATRVGVK